MDGRRTIVGARRQASQKEGEKENLHQPDNCFLN
jgi:hypothetical protein